MVITMNINEIIEIDSKHYFKTFNRFPVSFTHGEGCKLYDTEGKEYTDFSAGIAVNSLGHNDKDLVNAIASQASKCIHICNLYYNEPQTELAKMLTEGSDFARAFFCNSGAEANEGAIKLARGYFYKKGTPREKIVTAKNSFHGRTLATVTATGQPKYSAPFAPLPQGFVYVDFNDISQMEQAVDSNTAAVMLEVIQAEGGVYLADKEYLKAVEDICKKNGALLIIDEVQTGMGRTGSLFGYQQFNIKPDIISLAKGLGGGVPIGAVLSTEEASKGFAAGDHGTTFGGNPLACSAAKVVVNKLKGGLIEHAAEMGEYMKQLLNQVKSAYENKVVEVRGKGLLLGMELAPEISVRMVIDKLLKMGYIVISCGHNALRFVPPLIIKKEEIDFLASALKEVLASV